MAQEWKEWYLTGPDGDYKLCRGTVDGEAEVALYFQNKETGKFELTIQIIGMSELDSDALAYQLIKEYDTEKIFSKGSILGTRKATGSN